MSSFASFSRTSFLRSYGRSSSTSSLTPLLYVVLCVCTAHYNHFITVPLTFLIVFTNGVPVKLTHLIAFGRIAASMFCFSFWDSQQRWACASCSLSVPTPRHTGKVYSTLIVKVRDETVAPTVDRVCTGWPGFIICVGSP